MMICNLPWLHDTDSCSSNRTDILSHQGMEALLMCWACGIVLLLLLAGSVDVRLL
jgi:uncharacterized Zn finger protein